MDKDPTQILRTSAEILAAAVLRRCPDAFILGGGVIQGGFAYDFHFPSPFSKEMLPYIEQTCLEMISQDLPIRHLEMMPDNAATFFKHHKRFYPAKFAEQAEGPLVDVFEIEGFVDLCEGPYPKSTGELEEIKILEMSKRPPIRHRKGEKSVIRIQGTLKRFLKKKREIQNIEEKSKKFYIIQKERGKDHREIHRCFWLPKGVEMRQMLLEQWKKILSEKEFEIVETQGENLQQNHENLRNLKGVNLSESPWRVAEIGRIVSDQGIDPWNGLYESIDQTYDRAHIFCLKKDLPNELISSLQLLRENSKIFGFESTLELRLDQQGNHLEKACQTCGLSFEKKEGKQTQLIWKIVDKLGRKWEGPFLLLEQREKEYIVTCSLFNQLERLIAFFLDTEKIDFGFELSSKKKKI